MPQKVPRSLSGYQDVSRRAQAGAPRPCRDSQPGSATKHKSTGGVRGAGPAGRAQQHGSQQSHLQDAIERPQPAEPPVGAAQAKGHVDNGCGGQPACTAGAPQMAR